MTLDTQAAPATAADTGPLTIDQAVERQLARKAAPPVEQEPVPGAETVESPEGEGEAAVETEENSEAAAQAADDGEEAPETDTLDTEQVQEPDPAQPKLEAPARWEAEDKALFATLPKKAQETILRREKLQQAEVTRAQQKSAEVAKTFETRVKHLNSVAERIGEHVEKEQVKTQEYEKTLQDWDEWFASGAAVQMSREDNASYLANEAAHRQLQGEYRQHIREINKAKADQAEASKTAFAEFVKDRVSYFKEHVPELVEPKAQQELVDYLKSYAGGGTFEMDNILGISGPEAQIALKAKKLDDLTAKFANDGGLDALIRDAELYRKSVKLATKPPPPKPKVNAGPSAPAAGQGQTPSSSEARFKALSAKKSLTIDEAAEKAELRQKLRK